MSDPTQKPPHAVAGGLKAEAAMGLQPEKSSSPMRRLVEYVVDSFRDFSEAHGLRWDQIRLQQADVAITVAEMARRQLEADRIAIQPVAPKVLVPLIEKASLEAPEGEMVQRWASLLARAASPGGLPPRLIQIISELEVRQVALLERATINGFEMFKNPRQVLRDSAVELGLNQIEAIVDSVLCDDDATPESIIEAFVFSLERPGALYLASSVFSDRTERYDLRVPDLDVVERDIAICESLGLMKLVRVPVSFDLNEDRFQGQLSFCHLTALGIELVEACAPQVVKTLEATQS
ncbi:hypothetical protein [Methylobacterium sp. Leaf89]|uniref:Abi-alpha family protein n=1 Tax=Methylobacterium sp. Leaf89 TaxID=1736245 RepID=UPI001AEC579D|nr:hypothetical protein [Methylobacterium sp. Leaf89]